MRVYSLDDGIYFNILTENSLQPFLGASLFFMSCEISISSF